MQVEMKIGDMLVEFNQTELNIDIRGHKRSITVNCFHNLVEETAISFGNSNSVYIYALPDESCVIVLRDNGCNESQHLSKGEMTLLKIAVYSYYGLNK
jgi:hypothetical protein